MLYLHLAAVVRYDEAEQDNGGEADDGLEGQGVDGALRGSEGDRGVGVGDGGGCERETKQGTNCRRQVRRKPGC